MPSLQRWARVSESSARRCSRRICIRSDRFARAQHGRNDGYHRTEAGESQTAAPSGPHLRRDDLEVVDRQFHRSACSDLEQGELEGINRSQRIVLLAEEFDFQVLATSEWLYENHDVDIRCYRLTLAADGAEQFLTCARIYPPPELTDQARPRRVRSGSASLLTDNWPSALQRIENAAAKMFFLEESEGRREGSARRKLLRFHMGGRVRYRMWATRNYAYVSQSGRFHDDEKFWAARLDDPNEIKPIHGGDKPRFRLRTEQDFLSFKQAYDGPLQNIAFTNAAIDSDRPEYDEEGEE